MTSVLCRHYRMLGESRGITPGSSLLSAHACREVELPAFTGLFRLYLKTAALRSIENWRLKCELPGGSRMTFHHNHILAACRPSTHQSQPSSSMGHQEPHILCRHLTHHLLACTMFLCHRKLASQTRASRRLANDLSSTVILFSQHACLPPTSRSFCETRATRSPIFRVAISPTTFQHVRFSCLIKHCRLKREPPGGSHSRVLMLNNNKDSGFDINATTTICRKWVPPLSLLCASPTNHVCPIVNAAPPGPRGVRSGVAAGVRELSLPRELFLLID
jgi:hypothetical protein